MVIQWFPGHMAKARREIEERLKMIDVVIELLDARIPLSSQNPMIDEIVKQKPRLVLLNKRDLADQQITDRWISYFTEKGHSAFAVDSLSGSGVHRIPDLCAELVPDLFARWEARGQKPRAIRALILGIPNVGKSSLINRLARRTATRTGDRPGVTKAQQWIRAGGKLELLDTPGILWPKFEDQQVGYRLAATGAIKDELLNMVDISLFVVDYFHKHYPERIQERFKIVELPEDNIDLLEEIGRKRGCLVKGGEVDLDKAAEIFLRELRSGKLGRYTLEDPSSLIVDEE